LPMKKDKIPQTDSIHELAKFWDTHDLADYEEQLEEIAEPVFEREQVVRVQLPSKEAEAVENLAKSKRARFSQLDSRMGAGKGTKDGVNRNADMSWRAQNPPPMINSTRQEILRHLERISELDPDVRFGQLVANLAFLAAGPWDQTLWDLEDDALLSAARQHAENLTQRCEEPQAANPPG